MIIKLETQHEEFASNDLSKYIQDAMNTGNKKKIVFIRSLWDNEPWASIVKKVNTEGSTWYVWWMDGVRKFMLETSIG